AAAGRDGLPGRSGDRVLPDPVDAAGCAAARRGRVAPARRRRGRLRAARVARPGPAAGPGGPSGGLRAAPAAAGVSRMRTGRGGRCGPADLRGEPDHDHPRPGGLRGDSPAGAVTGPDQAGRNSRSRETRWRSRPKSASATPRRPSNSTVAVTVAPAEISLEN